ncbi:MAG TPA: hypothetical protein VE398_20295 [Acidobacteriota bacterium]|nr:hypothetical protein [Acidobacteriota bacterium]
MKTLIRFVPSGTSLLASFCLAVAQTPQAAAAPPNSTQPAYGPSIIKYLEGKGISWAVWCFDPEWGPTLIRDWQYTPTPAGEFAKQVMVQSGWK